MYRRNKNTYKKYTRIQKYCTKSRQMIKIYSTDNIAISINKKKYMKDTSV